MEAILFFIPPAADLALDTSEIRHPPSEISVSAAAATVTTADDLDSPISLSSGYCSDDDRDEQAAVRRGGDCWLPSTVVEQSPMSALKLKRRHHLERGQHDERSNRRRRHVRTTSRSANHDASLIDCLDPFRTLGADDTFTANDEHHRLPPLQIDLRLADCEDDDPLMDCRVLESETTIGAMYSPQKRDEARLKNNIEKGGFQASDSFSASSVEDNTPFNLNSWLKSAMGDSGNGDSTEFSRSTSKNDVVERTEQLREVVGSRLLIDLLLGQATYRNMTSSATRQHDAHSVRTYNQTTMEGNTVEQRDNGMANNGATLFTDSEIGNNDSVSNGTSDETRMPVCPADGGAIASNTSSTCSAIAHSSVTAKKARCNDVIASFTCCEQYENVGRKLPKPSTSCSDFSPAAETPSSPTNAMTSPVYLAKLPVVALSDLLYPNNMCTDDEYRKQRVTMINAVVSPTYCSIAGTSASNTHQNGSQHAEISASGVTIQPSYHMYSSRNQNTATGSTRSSSGVVSGGSLVLEALLRSATKLDANRGSDVASFVMKDGLPTVLVESVNSFRSSTAPCSSDEYHPSTSTSEPGLLHRLLTGQVDEADINKTIEAVQTYTDLSSAPISVSKPTSSTSGGSDQQLQVEELSSGSSSSAGLFSDVLDIDDCTGEALNESDYQQLMTSSVDDITATIGIKEDFLEKYLHEIWTTARH